MHSRVLAGLALAMSLQAVALAAAEPKKVALLVGVNNYQRRSFPDLQYAERDAEELAEELQRLGFQTTLLRGSDKGASRATRKNVEAALQQLVAETTKDDIVLVSLSGHGAQFEAPQADGSLKEDAFFCPLDATLGDLKTFLSLSYLIDDVLAKKGGRNLLLVDACRDKPPADASRGLVKKGVQGKRVDLPENTAVLFACSAGQESVESPRFGGGHGAFTYCVLEALRTKGAANGELTWSDVVAGVETLMAAAPEVQRVLAHAPPQDPIHAGHVKRTVLGKCRIPSSLTRIAHPANPAIESFVNSLGMKLVRIPAGEFTMGTDETDEQWLAAFPAATAQEVADQRPAHRVRISRPLLMGMHEVTLGQFETFCNDANYIVEAIRDGAGGWGYTGNPEKPREQSAAYSPWVTGFPRAADHPVVNVTWNDAQAFCVWLSRKEKLTYRLPTEAEWEYACRAGTTTRYWTGDDPESLVAAENIADASTSDHFRRLTRLSASDSFAFTAPVGSLRPNPFGLYDMHGNVSEWCADGYDPHRYQSRVGRLSSDPQATPIGSTGVLRGGGWDGKPAFAGSAFRYNYTRDHRYYSDGFRLVVETAVGQTPR